MSRCRPVCLTQAGCNDGCKAMKPSVCMVDSINRATLHAHMPCHRACRRWLSSADAHLSSSERACLQELAELILVASAQHMQDLLYLLGLAARAGGRWTAAVSLHSNIAACRPQGWARRHSVGRCGSTPDSISKVGATHASFRLNAVGSSVPPDDDVCVWNADHDANTEH